jgi:YcxB-like protein
MTSKKEELNGKEVENILYENIYTPTKELYKETVKVTTSRLRKYFFWFYAMVCGLMTICMIVKRDSIFHTIFFSIMTILFTAAIPIERYKLLKLSLRQEQTMFNGKMGKRDLRFYSKKMVTLSGNEIYYSNITKIRKGKNCVILIVNKAVCIMVKKDAFVKGNYEEFIQFIYSMMKIKNVIA